MAIGRTGDFSAADLKSFIELFKLKDGETEEDKTVTEETAKSDDQLLFEKSEIGGNGEKNVSTIDDIDSMLKKINDVITINSDITFADIEKTRNSLLAKKSSIQLEQDEKQNSILGKFSDAISLGKEISSGVRFLIDEIHDENIKSELNNLANLSYSL